MSDDYPCDKNEIAMRSNETLSEYLVRVITFVSADGVSMRSKNAVMFSPLSEIPVSNREDGMYLNTSRVFSDVHVRAPEVASSYHIRIANDTSPIHASVFPLYTSVYTAHGAEAHKVCVIFLARQENHHILRRDR